MGIGVAKWTSQEHPADVGSWASRASSRAHLLGTWPSLAGDQASCPLGQPLIWEKDLQCPTDSPIKTILLNLWFSNVAFFTQPFTLFIQQIQLNLVHISGSRTRESRVCPEASLPPSCVSQVSCAILSAYFLNCPSSSLKAISSTWGRSHFIPGFSLFHWLSGESGFFFFLNWGIVALQRGASFCCTHKWISSKYTDIPSL